MGHGVDEIVAATRRQRSQELRVDRFDMGKACSPRHNKVWRQTSGRKRNRSIKGSESFKPEHCPHAFLTTRTIDRVGPVMLDVITYSQPLKSGIPAGYDAQLVQSRKGNAVMSDAQ